jgi:predicted nucleotidyltransferase
MNGNIPKKLRKIARIVRGYEHAEADALEQIADRLDGGKKPWQAPILSELTRDEYEAKLAAAQAAQP